MKKYTEKFTLKTIELIFVKEFRMGGQTLNEYVDLEGATWYSNFESKMVWKSEF